MARNWKKMSKEEEDKKRQETIDKAIETMNKGIYEYLDSDRFKTLLDTMSKFHDYSMNNTLLILGQNPRATHLAGYNKWQQDFNRQVKRGEKGLMIWMPVEIKVKEKQYVLDENGNRILGDDGKFKKEAKRVDKIFDEMLKRELKYKTINFTREHFETVDTARDVMRVEEKMDELYNNGDISGKTHDEVLNHLSEVEEALYERIKDNMENNFLFKTQVENAVNADGEFGYKRALYNQDDVYKDVVKDVLEIDDLQKDADEMEL